jgi:predicted RNase H-like HicB family nuclease
MEPDLMEVGSSLEEALQLKKELEDLRIKLTVSTVMVIELMG